MKPRNIERLPEKQRVQAQARLEMFQFITALTEEFFPGKQNRKGRVLFFAALADKVLNGSAWQSAFPGVPHHWSLAEAIATAPTKPGKGAGNGKTPPRP